MNVEYKRCENVKYKRCENVEYKRCENVKFKRCENVKKINAASENPKKLIFIIHNTNKPIKHFVVFGFIMHAYTSIYAKRRRNRKDRRQYFCLHILFSNAAYTCFLFYLYF